eukprot:m.192010 g.192010  ORF g.192010 m.192010 type:complete len:173 (+) comp18536_c0_seq1:1477-1995(+)
MACRARACRVVGSNNGCASCASSCDITEDELLTLRIGSMWDPSSSCGIALSAAVCGADVCVETDAAATAAPSVPLAAWVCVNVSGSDVKGMFSTWMLSVAVPVSPVGGGGGPGRRNQPTSMHAITHITSHRCGVTRIVSALATVTVTVRCCHRVSEQTGSLRLQNQSLTSTA